MTGKATVVAPSNIAFIKYWGARDLERVLPMNASISMTLTECVSLSTVAFADAADEPDRIELADDDGALTRPPTSFSERALAHLDRMRRWSGRVGSFRVATRNSFPTGSGMASSASGFAALTLAATKALGLTLSTPELSDLARMSGSGSAARSVLGGYVAWSPEGEGAGHAVQLASASHWDLRDVIALVDHGEKDVSSIDGHRAATSSPHFEARQRSLPERLMLVRRAIEERDLAALGPVLEEEAVELHIIAMSSKPPIFYWKPGTVQVLERLRRMRRDGVDAFATMDAGANVHVICEPRSEAAVIAALEGLSGVSGVLLDGVGPGPREEREHLF